MKIYLSMAIIGMMIGKRTFGRNALLHKTVQLWAIPKPLAPMAGLSVLSATSGLAMLLRIFLIYLNQMNLMLFVI